MIHGARAACAILNLLLLVVFLLLQPSTLLAACCVGGTALRLAGRRIRLLRRAGTMLLGTGLAGLLIVLMLPVDMWLLRPLEERFPASPLPAKVEGVVVLGGGLSAWITADRGLPVLNRDGGRLLAFATLSRRYPDALLVFAGGPPERRRGGLGEADATRIVLEGLGVEPGRVLYDNQSRTTWQNAENALALARPAPGQTWILVTSASHMPRAMGAFRGAGWPPMLAWPAAYRTTRTGWSIPLLPVGDKLAALDIAAHEWVGLVSYWLRGRTRRLLPAP